MVTPDLDGVVLLKGAHSDRSDGVCALELAAWLAGEKHSDHPDSVSPVLGSFFRSWNDSVSDDFRQSLKPFILRLLGTADDGKDERRAWIATDWLVRVYTPAWLDLAKLTSHAMALRTAEDIRDIASEQRVKPLLEDARQYSYAAWSAAWDAAWDAARDAAWDAARDAAWDAARAAAWDAAGAAAWNAARDAARDAAWDAARDAAGAAAGAAAWNAAWNAARDAAWAAAWDAAWAALLPTVEALQAEALILADRLILGE